PGEEDYSYALTIFYPAAVTFSFDAPITWDISFKLKTGDVPGASYILLTLEPTTLSPTGRLVESLSLENQWALYNFTPVGPGQVTLTLSFWGSEYPDGCSAMLSDLRLGPNLINLQLWFADQNAPITSWVDELDVPNLALEISNNGFAVA